MSPSPKSGTAGSPVSPAAPGAAGEADVADPGKAAAARAQEAAESKASHGATAAEPFSPTEEDIEEKSWIEIEMVDEEDNPVPGERYEITVPDGSVASGTLDEKGFARVEGIDPGTCQITFPERDKEAWRKI
jgi:type VI secretion system secreted protein VgrG